MSKQTTATERRTLAERAAEIMRLNPKWGRNKIAAALGVNPVGTLRRVLELLKAGKSVKDVAALAEEHQSEQSEFSTNSAVISTRRANVRTLEELLAYMSVDLTVWEVERHVINKWEVGGKPGESNTLKANTDSGFAVEPLYQVKAWLKRKQPTAVETGMERLVARLEKNSKPAKLIRIKASAASHRRYALEISLFDAHFGLLAWGKETGENYDLKIAEQRYSLAVQDLLEKTRGCKPELIVFPIGNDFFHVNNPEGVTPAAHNRLDVDGRLAKIVETGQMAIINAINACLQVAPVRILWIPGNHDPQTSFFLCLIIRAYFHLNPNVTVDVSPAPRKYFHYGINLIGYTHGNEERHADLPTIMAGEQRAVWGQIKHSEWHVGHLHKKKETRYSAGDTYGGVSVRTIPSICGTDAWHFQKGYVNGERVAEATLLDHDLGLVANYTSKNFKGR